MIRIGLADDQALIREGIARLIELAPNAQVIWQAENGEQALKRLAAEPVEVLVCDIRMPQMDGITLLRRLRGAETPRPC